MACASLLFFMTSCVDDRCDLSNGVDATIAFGKGISVPIGSTAKIMLSEIIDTAKADALEIDTQTGDYSIAIACALVRKAAKGDLSAASFVRDSIGEKPKEELSVSGGPIFISGENDIRE